jgi:hypothetical protein
MERGDENVHSSQYEAARRLRSVVIRLVRLEREEGEVKLYLDCNRLQVL